MKPQFQQWLLSASGQRFIDLELDQLSGLEPVLCGSMGLQATLSEQRDYMENSNVANAVHLIQAPSSVATYPGLAIADTSALPFDSNEFNVVLAPHLVELSVDPHAALREIYRVTAPEGQVMLSGFNPYSLIGIQSLLSFDKYRFGSKVSLPRMKDWLKLLGFEVTAGCLFHYSILNDGQTYPRISSALESIGNRWLPMTSGAYILVVKKRIFSQTLVGRKQKKLFKANNLSKSLANDASNRSGR